MNAPQDKFHQVMTRLVDLMKHVVLRLAITKLDPTLKDNSNLPTTSCKAIMSPNHLTIGLIHKLLTKKHEDNKVQIFKYKLITSLYRQ